MIPLTYTAYKHHSLDREECFCKFPSWFQLSAHYDFIISEVQLFWRLQCNAKYVFLTSVQIIISNLYVCTRYNRVWEPPPAHLPFHTNDDVPPSPSLIGRWPRDWPPPAPAAAVVVAAAAAASGTTSSLRHAHVCVGGEARGRSPPSDKHKCEMSGQSPTSSIHCCCWGASFSDSG